MPKSCAARYQSFSASLEEAALSLMYVFAWSLIICFSWSFVRNILSRTTCRTTIMTLGNTTRMIMTLITAPIISALIILLLN